MRPCDSTGIKAGQDSGHGVVSSQTGGRMELEDLMGLQANLEIEDSLRTLKNIQMEGALP